MIAPRLLSSALVAAELASYCICACAQVLPANDLPLRIGADQSGGNRFLGEIACVRIYGRALTGAEIAGLARRKPGAPIVDKSLIAWWALGSISNGVCANRGALAWPMKVVESVVPMEVGGIPCARLSGGYLEAQPLPKLHALKALSVEAWVRPGVLPTSGARIVDQITPGGSDGFLVDAFPGNALRMIVGGEQLQAGPKLTADAWRHICATVTGDGTMALYIDGAPVAGGTAPIAHAFPGQMPAPRNPLSLWYRRPAAAWTEALPIGNGRLGGMIYGGVAHERIALNDDTLWSGEPKDTMPKGALAALPEVRRLLLAGKNREAHNLVAAKFLGPYFQSYLPLGDLSLDFGDTTGTEDYRRELELSTGIARVRYRIGDATYTREIIASHPADAIVIRLSCDKPGRVSVSAGLATQLRSDVRADGNVVALSGRCPSFLDAYTGKPTVYESGPDGKGMRFEMRLRVVPEGGSLTTGADQVIVAGADAVTLTLAAATSFNGFDKSPSKQGRDAAALCDRVLAATKDRSYDRLLAEHAADFRSLMGRVDLDLGEGRRALPTDERIRAYAPGEDPALAALYYQFGRYLIVSGSRPGSQPLNLQGIWNDRLVAPWASNWTLNCNAEINYWPAEAANLSECHLPIVDMARELSVDGTRVAKEMYGAQGWMAHHNADLWRAATPVSGDPVWAIFQVGGAWLCRHAFEHYAFTGDREYLRGVWPTMREAARYFLTSMIEEPIHHWLVTAPDTNFENYFTKPDGESAAVCMGPTASMQIVRQLFLDCVQASAALGVDADFRAEVQTALPRLAPMQVSPRTGELQEWLDDWDHASPGDGQILSTWGLVCAAQITPRGTPDLAKALRKSIDDRKPWNYSVGSWAGSFMSNSFARLEDAEMAATIVDKHLKRSLNPNMTAKFDTMAEWEIDGNLGETAAIGEMLLQSQAGEVSLLPALPKEWPSGSVRGCCARGSFTVDMQWKSGKLARAAIRSKLGGTCIVRSNTTGALKVHHAGYTVMAPPDATGAFRFETKAGEEYVLSAD